MRFSLTALLLIAILLGGGYWFESVSAECQIPIAYRIGTIDPRFNISYDEVRSVVGAAEGLWEDASGQNLFNFSEEAELTVNFLFDDRQESTLAAEVLRDHLETKEELSESVQAEYTSSLKKFEALDATYEARVVQYKNRLTSYNDEVEKWNTRGGAPVEVFSRLEDEKIALAKEQTKLNQLAAELNTLVRAMNTLGREGNSLIDDYNQTATEYNNRFGTAREFAQGDYTGREINIYQFESREELIIVLAHEFGHAMGINHVAEETSMMYYLMGAQSLAIGVTPFDLEAFSLLCDEPTTVAERLNRFWDRLREVWRLVAI